MKLKNKKTGEIIEPCEIYCDTQDKICVRRPGENFGVYIDYKYNSLAELNREWEDYEEPKKHYWVIDDDGVLVCRTVGDFTNEGMCKQIGNYFESEEEARKAVGRLYAWKRLKDFGCRFVLDDHFAVKFVGPDARKITSAEEQKSLSDSYKLLFGGAKNEL